MGGRGFGEVVAVGVVKRNDASGASYVLLRYIRGSLCTRENKQLLRWDVFPSGEREGKILGQDLELNIVSISITKMGHVRTGLCANVSLAKKVLSSENVPSSNTSMNSTPPARP